MMQESENLRCPRCDSSNTKFCYYNNYNLTQPRHFCKTCRRYWTKGGALRNVPIGGGCRKNKATTAKLKPKAGLLEHTDAHPMLWASPQNGTHFLSLLRPNQINPSPSLKEEGMMFASESSAMSARALGFDPFGPAHLPSMPLSVNSSYRNQAGSGQGIGDGLQEVYQRLRSSSTNYYPEHAPLIPGSTASAASPTILESSPVEVGFWNPSLSWPADFPTTNAAYP